MSGAALARRIERRIIVLVAFANAVGVAAIVASAAGGFVRPPGGESAGHVLAVNLLCGGTYLVVASAFGFGHLHRRFRPIARWLAEERPATADERSVVLTQPHRHTSWVALYWALAAIGLGVLNLTWYPPGIRIVEIVGGTLLFGVVPCAMTFVFVEFAMRPAFARALQGADELVPAHTGVLMRLVVAWLLGSGVFFVHIFLVGLGRRPRELVATKDFLLLLAGTGFVTGLVMTLLISRSLSDRLVALRAAQQRVQHGDLDAAVVVDDASEVGLLQSGFNEMVGGLRLFGRHVGMQVARRALEHGAELGGEERVVSVLFVDVVGSTALAQRHAPSDVVTMLNAFFSAVVHAVSDEGGWLNKFEGDAALCVFGAPEPQPDHAARALRAACALRTELTRAAIAHPELDAGIGVSTGTVVAGTIGAADRHEYTVIGDAVNEAARLSEVAKLTPGRVLASGRTLAAAPSADGWVPGEELTLRGRLSPTYVFAPQ